MLYEIFVVTLFIVLSPTISNKIENHCAKTTMQYVPDGCVHIEAVSYTMHISAFTVCVLLCEYMV